MLHVVVCPLFYPLCVALDPPGLWPPVRGTAPRFPGLGFFSIQEKANFFTRSELCIQEFVGKSVRCYRDPSTLFPTNVSSWFNFAAEQFPNRGVHLCS